MSLSEDTAKDIRDIGDAIQRLRQLCEENVQARAEQQQREADIDYQLDVLSDRYGRLLRAQSSNDNTDNNNRKRSRIPVHLPYVNAMTGEVLQPKDCSCNFSGSCLAYCNPYK
jgi:hypothetical protein